MSLKKILNTTNHRPWEAPTSSWKFYQEWNDVIFLHYQVDVNELKKFVPNELEIDLFEEKAWVSVVAFTMEKIRPKNLPYFPPISNFDEINIRTYVKMNQKTGVYFLSIEAGKKLSCKIASKISELPYRYSKIRRTTKTYSASNIEFKDKLHIDYKIGEQINHKTNLDQWLTERYALFQDSKNTINQFEIHHLQWPIQSIKINKLHFNYPRFNNLLNTSPLISHYSKGVKVLAWDKLKIKGKQ